MSETPGGGNAPFALPTLAEIRAWVAGLPDTEIVGTCKNAEHCLVAYATETLNPGMTFEVLPDIGQHPAISGDGYSVLLPDDLNKLALLFDEQDPTLGSREMTAAETLPIIDRVMQEVGQ